MSKVPGPVFDGAAPVVIPERRVHNHEHCEEEMPTPHLTAPGPDEEIDSLIDLRTLVIVLLALYLSTGAGLTAAFAALAAGAGATLAGIAGVSAFGSAAIAIAGALHRLIRRTT